MCSFTEEQREFLANSADGPGLAHHLSSYNLYMGVKYIFDQIENFPSEFHFSDILFPFLTPKRSFVFMATLYDFYTSCCELDEIYEELDTVEGKCQEKAQREEKLAELKEKILQNEENKNLYKERAKNIKKQLADLSVRHEEEQQTIKEYQAEEQVQLEKLKVCDDHEQKMQDEFSKVDNERQYYESLVVSDDQSQIIENYGKLTKKKEECFSKLRELEQQVHDGSSKVTQFEKVLSLCDDLNQNLRGEVSVENKTLDLKGLWSVASSLKQEIQALEKEETKLQAQVKEKDEAIPCQANELARLEAEQDSVACTWKEKQGRYRSLIADLQRSLSELSHRAEIEEAGLRDTIRKIEDLAAVITVKENELKEADEICKAKFVKLEEDLVRALSRISAQAVAYKMANLK